MSAVTRAQTTDVRDHGHREERELDDATVHDERLLLTVCEAARRLGIGRTLMYELIGSGRVQSVHVGRLRRIPLVAVDRYVRELCSGQSRPLG